MQRVAMQEPVAFWGGAFAGALGLNLQEDPLKSWLQRTASDAGVIYERMNKFNVVIHELKTRRRRPAPQRFRDIDPCLPLPERSVPINPSSCTALKSWD